MMFGYNRLVRVLSSVALVGFGFYMFFGIAPPGQGGRMGIFLIFGIIAAVFGLSMGRGFLDRGGRSRELERPELPSDQILAEFDELRGRIAELEERVDFAERLLAKAREGDNASRDA